MCYWVVMHKSLHETLKWYTIHKMHVQNPPCYSQQVTPNSFGMTQCSFLPTPRSTLLGFRVWEYLVLTIIGCSIVLGVTEYDCLVSHKIKTLIGPWTRKVYARRARRGKLTQGTNTYNNMDRHPKQ